MPYNVTSSFIHQSRSKTPANLVRKFTIGSSDYSQFVNKWPKFKRRWDEIRPINVTLPLANANGTFGFLRTDKTNLQNQAVLSMGFNDGGEEIIDIFAGTIRSVSYEGAKCNVTLVDKFQQLSDRKVGTNDDPVSYVGSNYLPSDLALWAITSYGGFSATANSSNPDIMWEDFSSWAYVFSSDTVYMEARWTGQKVTEILRKIARQTHSSITISDNKISFKRFGLADSNVSSLGDDQIKDVGVSFDLNTIVNKQSVSGDFIVGSTHQFTIEEVNSSSVNSFGAKENVIEDQNLWYVNSASAINLAERLIRTNALPDDYIMVTAGLVGLPRQVGETVAVIHPFYAISESYRILEYTLDMDRGLTMMGADRRQLTNAFILNTSSLNSTTDVLT